MHHKLQQRYSYVLRGIHTARRTAQQSSYFLRSIGAARRCTAPRSAVQRRAASYGAARRCTAPNHYAVRHAYWEQQRAVLHRFCCSNRSRFDFAVWCRTAQCECPFRLYFGRFTVNGITRHTKMHNMSYVLMPGSQIFSCVTRWNKLKCNQEFLEMHPIQVPWIRDPIVVHMHSLPWTNSPMLLNSHFEETAGCYS